MKVYGIVTHDPDPEGDGIVVWQMFLTREMAESECNVEQHCFITIKEYEIADELVNYFEAGFYSPQIVK